MMQNLAQELMAAGQGRQPKRLLPRNQYREWLRQFTWDSMNGLTYGESFCLHFGIWDNILFSLKTVQEADRYIKDHYLDARGAHRSRSAPSHQIGQQLSLSAAGVPKS